MELSTNIIIIVVAVLLSITLIYFILPKLNLGKYGAAIFKTALAWAMIGYMIFDLYKKESYGLIVALIIGAFTFAYTAFNAKTKNQ
jgi:type II secretory pathway component PulF